MVHILFHELKYYFKNLHEVIYIYGFFVLIMLVVPLGLRQQLHVLPELAPAVLWMAMTASIGLGAMQLFQRDAESGVLELYQQLPLSLGGAVLAKWLAFYIATTAPILASVPIILALFGLKLSLGVHYSLGLAAGASALTILASLAAAMTVGLERARAVLLLIVLPLAVPVIVFGSEYLRATGALWQPQLLFLTAFSVFLLPILYLAGPSCIRASN